MSVDCLVSMMVEMKDVMKVVLMELKSAAYLVGTKVV